MNEKLGAITKGQAIGYWSDDTIQEYDTIDFISQIKEYGFHNSVPMDAQAAMRSWANCDATEGNAYYLKTFAEIAHAALGIE